MRISTRGRYALRVVLDLAQHDKDGFVSLKSISQRQEVSVKYLEAIVALLNKAGIVMSQRGKDGGYRLAREPKDITAAEILSVTEGSIAPVACIDRDSAPCERAGSCMTMPMWRELDRVMDEYLSSVSVEDIIRGDVLR